MLGISVDGKMFPQLMVLLRAFSLCLDVCLTYLWSLIGLPYVHCIHWISRFWGSNIRRNDSLGVLRCFLLGDVFVWDSEVAGYLRCVSSIITRSSTHVVNLKWCWELVKCVDEFKAVLHCTLSLRACTSYTFIDGLLIILNRSSSKCTSYSR